MEGFFNVIVGEKEQRVNVVRLAGGNVHLITQNRDGGVQTDVVVPSNIWQSIVMSVCGDPSNSMISEIVGKIHAGYDT